MDAPSTQFHCESEHYVNNEVGMLARDTIEPPTPRIFWLTVVGSGDGNSIPIPNAKIEDFAPTLTQRVL
jgi:hypothetical protein